MLARMFEKRTCSGTMQASSAVESKNSSLEQNKSQKEKKACCWRRVNFLLDLIHRTSVANFLVILPYSHFKTILGTPFSFSMQFLTHEIRPHTMGQYLRTGNSSRVLTCPFLAFLSLTEVCLPQWPEIMTDFPGFLLSSTLKTCPKSFCLLVMAARQNEMSALRLTPEGATENSYKMLSHLCSKYRGRN